MKRRTDTQDADAPPVARETAVQTPPKLDPTLTAPAELLRRFIEVAETGYAICVCNAPAERRRILDSLLPEFADEGTGAFELELDETVPSIPGRIRVALTTNDFKALSARYDKVAISLTGAEATITDTERKFAGRPKVMQGLNQQRDWMDQLGHPIMFWVSEWLMGLLPRIAPDFWAGRSVVIEFPTADELRAHAYQEVSSDPLTFSSLDEARRKIRIYEDLLHAENSQEARAGFLHNLAMLRHALGDLSEARRLYDQSLAIEKELGDKSGIARTLHQLGRLAQDQGDYVEARKLYGQSVAIEKKLGDKSGIARTLHQLASLSYVQGDFDKARELYNQALGTFVELGAKSEQAAVLHQLAILAQDQSDHDKARGLYDQSLAIAQELGDKSGIATTLHQLAILAQTRGDYDRARKLYNQSLAIAQELGDKSVTAATMAQLAQVARIGDDLDAAIGYNEKSLAIRREIGDKAGIAKNLHESAIIKQLRGDHPEARKLYNQSLAIEQELGDKFGIAATLSQLGRLAEIERDDRTALRNYLVAVATFDELKSPRKDTVGAWIGAVQQRLGDEAFKKLFDEVVAELSKRQPDSQPPSADR